MKTTIKTSTSLVLLIIFIATCSILIFLLFAAGWLYTYKVFTRETPVAKVIISEQKNDSIGEYFEVEIQEIEGKPSVSALFNPEAQISRDLLEPMTFKLYGDTVDIGGPTIKFKDFFNFFNLETVYKIAFVRAEYSDITKEENRIKNMTRRIDLNGGYNTWRSVQEDVQNNTLRGQVLKIFIDHLPQLNSRGVFITSTEQELVLCVTEEGFLFCDKEI